MSILNKKKYTTLEFKRTDIVQTYRFIHRESYENIHTDTHSSL